MVDPQGKLLGRGFCSPGSAIPVRILSRDADEPLDAALIGRRIETRRAWRRARLGCRCRTTRPPGYRLVHAEGDDLPGLIVDVYGDVAVVQLLTVGMKRREEDALRRTSPG